MSRNYYYHDPWDEAIESLRRELSEARWLIITLMPDEIEEVLQGFLSCESRADRRRWPDVAADRIAELAKPIPNKGHSISV
jgi:hypothetical protein